jgi:hypothetical protein
MVLPALAIALQIRLEGITVADQGAPRLSSISVFEDDLSGAKLALLLNRVREVHSDLHAPCSYEREKEWMNGKRELETQGNGS